MAHLVFFAAIGLLIRLANHNISCKSLVNAGDVVL